MVVFDETKMEAINPFRIHIEVRNPRTHISEEKALYTDFEIETKLICDGNIHNSFRVRRRYSEFQWLRRKLQDIVVDRSPPELPCRRLFWRFEKEFLHHRKIGLEKFLNEVLIVEEYVSSPSLVMFLRTNCNISQIEDTETLSEINIKDALPELWDSIENIPSSLDHLQYPKAILQKDSFTDIYHQTNSPSGKGWAECFGDHVTDFVSCSLDSYASKKGSAYVLPGGQLVIPGLLQPYPDSPQSRRRRSADNLGICNGASNKAFSSQKSSMQSCLRKSKKGSEGQACSGQTCSGQAYSGQFCRGETDGFKKVCKAFSWESLNSIQSQRKFKCIRYRKWSSTEDISTPELYSIERIHDYRKSFDAPDGTFVGSEKITTFSERESSCEIERKVVLDCHAKFPEFNPRCLESSSERELMETHTFTHKDVLSNHLLESSHLEEYDIIFPLTNFEDRKSEFYNSYLHVIANNYAVDYDEYDIVDSMVDADSDSTSCILHCSNECSCSFCPFSFFCHQFFEDSGESENGIDEYDIISFKELY